MADTEALRKRFVDRLAAKHRRELIFSDITAALNSATPEIKAQIVDAFNRNDTVKFYSLVSQLLFDRYSQSATPSVNAIITRGTLTLDDVEDIFGPL